MATIKEILIYTIRDQVQLRCAKNCFEAQRSNEVSLQHRETKNRVD